MALAEGWPGPISRRATPPVDDWVEERVVWMRGEHDASTVVALSETLARAIAHQDEDLVVDLSAVAFMGVAAVRVLARAQTFLRARSRSLVLRAPSTSAPATGSVDSDEPVPGSASSAQDEPRVVAPALAESRAANLVRRKV